MKIKIINGPNLNVLEFRDSVYGRKSLEEIKNYTNNELGSQVELDWFQSNSESEIINEIQSLLELDYEGLVINPAGYSHTSVSIRDALELTKIPVFEVHLTNTHSREEFRGSMLTAGGANFIMSGLGFKTYYWACKMLFEIKGDS